MSDSIERIHEDQLFRCVPVEHRGKERKQGECFDFGEQKKGKKDNRDHEKLIVHDAQKMITGAQETNHKEDDKTCPEKNQCGNIIDIEA